MNLKKPQESLKKWGDQKWMTSSTASNKKKGISKEVKSNGTKRYLPQEAWDALSKNEKVSTNKTKAIGNKSGKQFTKQPKAIAKKVAKFRK